jgi:hypothetical protein
LLENRLALSALRPRESVSPGAVTPDQAADSAAGLRAEGQTQGGPGLEHLTIGLRRSASVVAAVTPPQRVSPRRAGRHQLTEHQDRATTPEASSPRPRDRGGTGLGCGGSSVPGPMANPGGWTVSAGNDRRRTEERRLPCPRYRQTGQRPPGRRVGLATGVSDLPLARSAGRALGGSSAATSTEVMPSSTTPAQANRGAKGSPGTLDPPQVATRAHGYLVASLARSRPRPSAKQKAGGSRPGGPRREPPTLIMNRSPDRALAQLQPLHQVASRRGLARRSSASSSRCITSSLRIRSSRAQGWEG